MSIMLFMVVAILDVVSIYLVLRLLGAFIISERYFSYDGDPPNVPLIETLYSLTTLGASGVLTYLVFFKP